MVTNFSPHCSCNTGAFSVWAGLGNIGSRLADIISKGQLDYLNIVNSVISNTYIIPKLKKLKYFG